VSAPRARPLLVLSGLNARPVTSILKPAFLFLERLSLTFLLYVKRIFLRGCSISTVRYAYAYAYGLRSTYG
jgi:hypothetical protein